MNPTGLRFARSAEIYSPVSMLFPIPSGIGSVGTGVGVGEGVGVGVLAGVGVAVLKISNNDADVDSSLGTSATDESAIAGSVVRNSRIKAVPGSTGVQKYSLTAQPVIRTAKNMAGKK
jgi:hypothetical protein